MFKKLFGGGSSSGKGGGASDDPPPPPPDPVKEMVRKWQRQLRKEQLGLDRQVRGAGARRLRDCAAPRRRAMLLCCCCCLWRARAPVPDAPTRAVWRPPPPGIQLEIKKVQKSIKERAKAGDMASARVRGREGTRVLAVRAPQPQHCQLHCLRARARIWHRPWACAVHAGAAAPRASKRGATAVHGSSGRSQTCHVCITPHAPHTPTTHAAPQMLAKEIVRSNKAISQLYNNKAHMMSISNSLTEQAGRSKGLAARARTHPTHTRVL